MNDRLLPVVVFAALLLTASGCNRQSAPPTDTQIAAGIEAKLHAEGALGGQNIQVAVDQGRVTLSGSATDPASRALAGNDAGSISGVRTVVNNLTVAAASQPPLESAAAAPAVQPAPIRQPSPPPAARNQNPEPVRVAAEHPPVEPPQDNQPLPTPLAAAAGPTTPPAPDPASAVTLQAGTVLPVRIVEDLSSATASPDMGFHATLAEDLMVGRMIAIPQGTPILGRVVDARDAAHFRGTSLLSIELTRIDMRGDHVAIVTDTWQRQGAARGKSAAEKVGGGAVLGTLIGALA
ncbi:MAG: BON domain-containing protein, partial [Acidobacteriaceae bacterium]